MTRARAAAVPDRAVFGGNAWLERKQKACQAPGANGAAICWGPQMSALDETPVRQTIVSLAVRERGLNVLAPDR